MAGTISFLSQIDGRVDLSVERFTVAVRAQSHDLGFLPHERVLICGVLAEPAVFVSCCAAIDAGADLSFADPRFVDEFELLKMIDDARPDVVVLPYSRALALVELGLTQERVAHQRVVVQASSPNESRLDHLASAWGQSLIVRTGPDACLQMGLVGRSGEFGLTFRPGCSVICRVEEADHALGVGMRGDLVIETPWGNSSRARDWRTKWTSNGSLRFEGDNTQSVAATRIAQALTGFAGVREVCVRDVDSNGYPAPMVWAECEADVGVTQMRAHLRSSLPGRFAPRIIVCTPSLPRTADGGVDVDRLPNPFRAMRQMRFEPPSTELEIAIAAIWRSCLGIANVGANDVFPEIGGTSLMALKVIADIQNAVQQRIEPRLLFFRSLRQIARSIEQSKRRAAP